MIIIHSEARYTRYHHRQSLFKNVQQYSFYWKISIFSIFPYLRNAKNAITGHKEMVITHARTGTNSLEKIFKPREPPYT